VAAETPAAGLAALAGPVDFLGAADRVSR
jgi:hypothetical protein